MCLFPQKSSPRGAGAPAGPGTKPTPGSTWARVGAGRGSGEEGRCSGARPPARSYQAARHRPRRPPANPARLLPGRTSPGDTRPSATPRLGPGTARAPASPEPANQRPGMRSPQARSRAGLTREGPPHAAPARAPLPHAPRRARATVVPRDRVCSCPTPNAGGPGWGGPVAPNTAADGPRTRQCRPRRERVSNKDRARDGNRGGGPEMRRQGLTRVQPPPGSAGAGGAEGKRVWAARELRLRRSTLGLRLAGERAGGERARGPSVSAELLSPPHGRPGRASLSA